MAERAEWAGGGEDCKEKRRDDIGKRLCREGGIKGISGGVVGGLLTLYNHITW